MKLVKELIIRLFSGLSNSSNVCHHESPTSSPPEGMTQREMIIHLLRIPNWKQRIEFYQEYEYFEACGVWIRKNTVEQQIKSPDNVPCLKDSLEDGVYKRIHYGCGSNLIEGWLNVDLSEFDAPNYRRVNLVEKHPFNDGTFEFAYAEDVLEHLTQAESLFFLRYRTLDRGGVARLSFPGLEGVLRRHYSPCSETRVREGECEAYAVWDHIHFFSREEIRLVGNHMGFQQIEFVEYGNSRHPELCGLDTRSDQTDLNIIVELRK